jgi:DNA-binding NarL/FixJ family response regulator
MVASMTSVVLVSKLSIIREGMKRILSACDDIEVVGEANYATEYFTTGKVPCAQVIILAYPGRIIANEELSQLQKKCPELRVIIVVHFSTLHQVLSAFKMGVHGLLNASCAASHLPAAIRAVSSGKIYMHEQVSSLIVADLDEINKDHTHKSLTHREMEIFLRLAAGRKISDIAAELGISAKTVSTHKARVMEKMGMNSSSQLIQYAIFNSLFEKGQPVA